MRYQSQTDSHMMRRLAADPSRYVRRGMVNTGGQGSRTRISGFGALTSIGSGSTAASAAAGASAGASIGSVVPIIGTGIGALVGGAVGAVMSAFNRQDKENLNFQQAQNMANQLGANSVLDINNKYLVLAGLFDLTSSQIKGNIPIYKKYGRMGEFKFVSDMCAVIQQAANAGAITANDTPQTVYAKVVLPWINSFGFGAMSDSNANMITMIIIGMIAEYCANIYTQRWFAVGGQMPFGSLPPFSLPNTQAAAQSVTASPSPSPQVTQSTPQTELGRYQAGIFPQAGATVNYARAAGGTWFQLPQSGTYLGNALVTGAWILNIAGSEWTLDSTGSIVPYIRPGAQGQLTPDHPDPNSPVSSASTAATSSNSVPAPVSSNTSNPVSASDSTGQQIPAQYIPSGGGGGYYPTQAPATASVTASAGGFSTAEIGIGAAVLLGVMYMLTQKKGSR